MNTEYFFIVVCFSVAFGTLLSCANAISASNIGLRNLVSSCSSAIGRGNNEEDSFSFTCEKSSSTIASASKSLRCTEMTLVVNGESYIVHF